MWGKRREAPAGKAAETVGVTRGFLQGAAAPERKPPRRRTRKPLDIAAEQKANSRHARESAQLAEPLPRRLTKRRKRFWRGKLATANFGARVRRRRARPR